MKYDRDLLWPTLEPATPEEEEQDSSELASDRKSIEQGDWSIDADTALEEARRLYDAEAERRRGADTKAGIYLAAITALVPVLTSLVPSIWSDKSGRAYAVISLLVFALAVTYLVKAGLWAFHTIKVSAFNQVHVNQLAKIWSTSSPKEGLAKEIARAVRLNYRLTNEKVTCIKMTHEFLLRAFLVFALLLFVQGLWPPAASFIEWTTKQFHTPKSAPLFMCYS